MEKLENLVVIPNFGQVALHPLQTDRKVIAIAEKTSVDVGFFKLGEILSLPPEDAERLLEGMGSRLLTQDEHKELIKYAKINHPGLYASLMKLDPSDTCRGELLREHRYFVAEKYSGLNYPQSPISPWTWLCFRQFVPEK